MTEVLVKTVERKLQDLFLRVTEKDVQSVPSVQLLKAFAKLVSSFTLQKKHSFVIITKENS